MFRNEISFYLIFVIQVSFASDLPTSRELPIQGTYSLTLNLKSLKGHQLFGHAIIYNGVTYNSDDFGQVSISIPWVFYRSVDENKRVKRRFRRLYNDLLNGEFIVLEDLYGRKYFIPNKYRKYGIKHPGNKYNYTLYIPVHSRTAFYFSPQSVTHFSTM